MKYMCESNLSEKALTAVLKQLPLGYSSYFNILGPEKIKALRYRRGDIEDYFKSESLYKSDQLLEQINTNFKVGDRLSSVYIKTKLTEIYKKLNISKIAKATDLDKFFILKDIKINTTTETGEVVRSRGYELLKTKD